MLSLVLDNLWPGFTDWPWLGPGFGPWMAQWDGQGWSIDPFPSTSQYNSRFSPSKTFFESAICDCKIWGGMRISISKVLISFPISDSAVQNHWPWSCSSVCSTISFPPLLSSFSWVLQFNSILNYWNWYNHKVLLLKLVMISASMSVSNILDELFYQIWFLILSKVLVLAKRV